MGEPFQGLGVILLKRVDEPINKATLVFDQQSALLERNIVSSFSACPEYSLANVELERLKRFDLWQGSWKSARRRWLS